MVIRNEKTFLALVDNLPIVIDYLDQILEAANCPMKVQIALDVAVEEMFVNVASYAYPDGNADKKGEVTIIVSIVDDGLGCEVSLIDNGIPYNPLEKPDPDVTLSAEEREIGGLGIYMVKNSMDNVKYSYENNSNIFTMYKRFE